MTCRDFYAYFVSTGRTSPPPEGSPKPPACLSCSEWLFVQRHNDFFSLLFLAPPSKLRNQAQSERYGYKEVVLKGDAKKLQLYGTCAVCLEDFRGKDELGVLPCQHAFHRKCLVKWLEVRCVCPMCNKPIAGPSEASQSIGILLDELV